MTNCIFFVFVLSICLNFSLASMKYSGVNRTFELLYHCVFEMSTNDLDEEANPIKPFFVKDKLIKNVEAYLDNNITRYTNEYVTAYYFYNPDDGSYCTSYCRGVRISLKAQLDIFYKFEKARNYYVREV